MKHLFRWDESPSLRSLHSTCPDYGSPEAGIAQGTPDVKFQKIKIWLANIDPQSMETKQPHKLAQSTIMET